VSNRDGDFEIYTMDIDGQNQKQLTFNETGEGGACWSPDGNKLAFSAKGTDSNTACICIMDADGENIKKLTNGKTYDFHPVWSPDGKKILFISEKVVRKSQKEICVINLDGQNRMSLYSSPQSHPSQTYHHCWSRDSRMVVLGVVTDRKLKTYTIEIANKHKVELTDGMFPIWQPRPKDN